MKTDDLISALVADTHTQAAPPARVLALAMIAGLALSAAIFAVGVGARSDLSYVALHSPAFVMKFVLTLGLALPAYAIVRRLARPEANVRGLLPWLAVVPVLLLAALAFEMVQVPREFWPVYLKGQNALACVVLIPLLSLAPLVAVLYALRQGAPANPTLAGAFGGLLSAATGATLYAAHCVDDSPFFVSVWYTLGIAAVVAVGALAGRVVLRW